MWNGEQQPPQRAFLHYLASMGLSVQHKPHYYLGIWGRNSKETSSTMTNILDIAPYKTLTCLLTINTWDVEMLQKFRSQVWEIGEAVSRGEMLQRPNGRQGSQNGWRGTKLGRLKAWVCSLKCPVQCVLVRSLSHLCNQMLHRMRALILPQSWWPQCEAKEIHTSFPFPKIPRRTHSQVHLASALAKSSPYCLWCFYFSPFWILMFTSFSYYLSTSQHLVLEHWFLPVTFTALVLWLGSRSRSKAQGRLWVGLDGMF